RVPCLPGGAGGRLRPWAPAGVRRQRVEPTGRSRRREPRRQWSPPGRRAYGLDALRSILATAGSRRQGKTGQRTACFSSFEGLKRGMRPATVTVWPVRGFRRVRGFLRATENVPNPTSVTASPRFSEARIPPSAARSARSVPALGQPDAAAIRATISAFVISSHTRRVHLHPERAARLVHHRFIDGRVAVLGGESLDRASRHGT